MTLVMICLGLYASSYSCRFYLKETTTEIWSEVLPEGSGRVEKEWVYANVGVNCKQTEDVYVTVHVYQNGVHIGSDIVTIPAGRLESGNTKIEVRTRGERGFATLKLDN